MSYVLEALKRSEEERRRGGVPDVFAEHVPVATRRPRRSRWPLLLVAALFANALVLLAWFKPWIVDQPTGPREEALADRPVPVAEPATERAREPPPAEAVAAAIPEARPAASESEAVTTVVPPPLESVAAETAAARREERAAAAAEPPEPAGEAATIEAAPDAAPPLATPPPPPPKPKPRTIVAERQPVRGPPAPVSLLPRKSEEVDSEPSGRSAPAEPSAASAAKAIDPPRTEPEPPQPVVVIDAPSVHDLTPAEQQALPEIAVTIHSFSPQAAARMVRINGRTLREGDSLAPNLKLAEVTKGGVIFSLNGKRFYMASTDRWPARQIPIRRN